MILCRNGHENPDGATYCAVCRVYIDASAAPVVPPTPVVPPPPVPVRPLVTLADAVVAVGAGDSATTDVLVQSTSDAVAEYVLEVEGHAAGWARIEPWTISLQPRATLTARLTLSPPPDVTGAYAFEVKVSSKLELGSFAVASGVLEVAPETPPQAFRAELQPPASEGRTSGQHVIALQNATDRQLAATFSASDPDGFLAFDIDPPSVSVPPASIATARLRVRARKRSFLRGARQRPFQVLVVPEGAAPSAVGGVFVQRRYVPLLLVPVAGVMALFVLLATVIVVVIVIAVIWYLLTHR
jgi:hypothetical protein